MSKFKREERFIVIKRKYLTAESRFYDSTEQELRVWLDKHCIPTSECVVVESDWPEYETVWSMIDARIEGRLTPYQVLEQQVHALRQHKTDYIEAAEGTRRALEAEAQALRDEVAALRQDMERLNAIEANCWDVHYDSSPNADAGDSTISIEIVGHYQGAPHVRVLGENYTENLRAAIDQAMTAEAYPPERPEYDERGRPVRATKSNNDETWRATKGAGGCDM